MNAWAVVVGCGAYPLVPGASAYGPIDDALAFRRWLLADGLVPQDQLRLLLSTPDGGASVPQAVSVDGVADLAGLTATVEEVVTQITADRLYLYFAGHGCPTDPDNPYFSQDAIVLTDFDPDRPQAASIAVRELITQLAQSDIREVVVILDAARGFPFTRSVAVEGFGVGWHGKRRSGAVVQFLIQATSMTDGSLTEAILDGLAGKAGSLEFGDLPPDDDLPPDEVPPDELPPDEVRPSAADRPGTGTLVRWWSLVEYLQAALPMHPPRSSGQDTSLILARPAGPGPAGGPTSEPTNAGGPATRRVDARETALQEGLGQFEFRSTDPNAMLTIENRWGKRLAVGVGSIEGRLPAGSHVGVLVDPVGVDPRVTFELAEGGTCVVVLDPTEQADGFRVTGDPALRWSSAAAQLAAATASIWSPGHRSFLLVGWTGEVGSGKDHTANAWDWADSVLPLGSELGSLTGPDGGWWKAFPITGPWCTLRAGNRRITVPIAPDSVSAVAITSTHTSVALFDTTHPAPAQIAAQDRVQQYLAVGRLGAADLTSRLAVEADRRWPWAATAAVRRLIDGARRARDEGSLPAETAANLPVGSASEHRGDPPHQFVAQVPPSARHQLVGRGPWAVWIDWP